MGRLRVENGAVKLAPMPHGLGRVMATVIAVAVLSARAVLAEAPAGERVIQYGKDRLTVHLTKVQVSEVLEEIGRQSGAEIKGELRSPHEVSAEFDDVPLPEALHRLLGDQNFALVYANGGGLKAVKLLGGPQTSGTPSLMTPTTMPVASPQNIAALIASHPAVPVSGRLSEAVGGPTATLQQLFDVGLHNEDSGIRAEAVRTGINSLESEPALRAAIVSQLNTMDDQALSTMLRSAAGDRAEEVAMQVLSQARATEFRVKASSILQKLRSGS